MKRLLSAIAAALRSTVSFVWERCAKTGAWTMRAIASVTGGGDSAPAETEGVMQEVERSMLDDLITKKIDVGVPPAIGGDGYDVIQRVCRDMNTPGIDPKPEDLAALSAGQREWLALLEPQMKLVVGNVPKEALIEHMKGRKGLRGVLRSDADSVAAWKHALDIERTIAALDEPEPDARLAM